MSAMAHYALCCTLLVLLFSLYTHADSSWSVNMLNGPLCAPAPSGLNNTMFGYSLSLSDGVSDGEYTYMAVGRPWDSSVFIYRAKTPNMTNPYLYAGLNGTSYPFTPPNYSPTNWTLVQYLRDSNNASSNAFQSLFGFSVSLSDDASTLAVGAPAKQRGVPYANPSAISTNQFNGVVRTFAKGWNASLGGTITSQDLTTNRTTLSLKQVNNSMQYTSLVPVDSISFVSDPEFITVLRDDDCYFVANDTQVASGTDLTNLTLGSDYYCNTATVSLNESFGTNAKTVVLNGTCSSDWTRPFITYKMVNVSCTMNLTFGSPFNFTYRPGLPLFTASCSGNAATTCSAARLSNWLFTSSNIAGAAVSVNLTLKDLFFPLNTTSSYNNFLFPYDMVSNSTALAYEKHGSKVLFSKDTNATFLYVTNNQGWDGMVINSVVRSNYSVERMGVFIYKRDPANPRNFVRFQFVNLDSPVPLGTLGLDLTVFGKTLNTTGFVVRDYYPVDWSKKPSGRATVYLFNGVTFVKSSVLNNQNYSTSSWEAEDWFGRGLSSVSLPEKNMLLVSVGAPRLANTSYLFQANWSALFNLSDTLNYTYYNSTALTIATPGEADASMAPFQFGQFIPNPNYRLRNSFFGGSTAFSPNGEFLIVSDSSNANGKGRVYLYRNYNATLRAFGLSTPATNPTLYANGRYSYYMVAELAKPVFGALSSTDSFKTDWFGMSLVANWWTIASSAAVDSCVHTYPVPQLYVDPSFYFIPDTATGVTNITRNDTAPTSNCNGTLYDAPSSTTNGSFVTYCCPSDFNLYLINNVTYCTNYTINQNTTNNDTSSNSQANSQAASESRKNAATYSIIAGVVAAVCIIPATWLLIREVHKRRYQKKLETELCTAMKLNPVRQSVGSVSTIGASDPYLMQTMFSSSDISPSSDNSV